ncbi:MAG: hypothetical protein GDA49_11790 [Rhodospirillales bacterium]|nr:hypothetical protein [Rhodospirillales bacterium]
MKTTERVFFGQWVAWTGFLMALFALRVRILPVRRLPGLAKPNVALIMRLCGLVIDRIVFAMGLGCQVTLSGLIAQVEFSRADFARAIAPIVAITRFTCAFGPGVVGVIADVAHGYGTALALTTAAMLVASAVLIVVGRPRA